MDNTEIKVLVLYGGENATKHRNALLDWLNSSELHRQVGRKIDARKVAAMVAHMEGSIDTRVEEMMDWADKGIILLTKDDRSDYGAPNVLEEFGRWIGQKGRRTALTLRQDGVKVHSNASGLVYVGFKNDVIAECRDRLIAFIADPVSGQESTSATQAPPPQHQPQTVNNAPVFNVGSVGGDLTAGDKIGGNVYHVTGDLNISHGATQSSKSNHSDSGSAGSQPQTSDGSSVTITSVELKGFLEDRFSTAEMQELCFGLNIEPEEFPSSKSLFIMQFIRYLQRRDRLDELVELLKKERGSLLVKKFGSQAITVSDS